ncbi:uncharacterized protein BP01DRAFT_14492 [Aspergillus saccharolyticus JOP 1030-1]|uniref:Uncharacterized protein n=1 Tax=Aspergillus saccharolyticus JOP 1030-1 TaxID=1450539 RepID=A0A318ZG05_9EURO|nr:hypothetical protein BP01DRAFT_14492 [Aspergillus saccharolyticus JOP 1030-1]PYH46379.1 hypothetical protein BP01DRAFT_14492 [Aspergillus saccharolyticus JOP 1030-1]
MTEVSWTGTLGGKRRQTGLFYVHGCTDCLILVLPGVLLPRSMQVCKPEIPSYHLLLLLSGIQYE